MASLPGSKMSAELPAHETRRESLSAEGRTAGRSRSPGRSRTIRAHRRLSTVLGLALAIALVATGFFWQTTVSLERERDGARRDLRIALQAWNQAGLAAQLASGYPDQQDARRMNFVADTLLPLNHPYLMTVFFGVSDDAAGTVGIDADVRLVNSGTVPLKPSARLEFHDFLGTKIGEAELHADNALEGNATMLLPDEMRLYHMRVPLDARATPAWFTMRWEAN